MFEPKAQNPALAALLIFVATAFIAATTLLAKALGTAALGPPLSPFQISHGRFLFAFVTILLAVAAMRPTLRRPHFGLHIGRTVFGWGGVTLMFASVAYIPMADATAISFLNPVFAMVLAIPLLKERVGPWRWGAAAIALIGALILLRPTPDSFQPAALLALSAAAIIGMELIFIKKLSGRESPLQIRAEASFVAPFSYATLIFAALYDYAGFGLIPYAISLTGAGIILGGALLLAWREGRNKALKSEV